MSIFVVLIAALLVSTACTPEKYPDDWPAPDNSLAAFFKRDGCPDVQGTWDIKIRKETDGRTTNGVWPLFGAIDRKYGSNFETLTISGDSREAITLRLERRFSTTLDALKATSQALLERDPNSRAPEVRFVERMKPEVRTAPPYDWMTDEQYETDLHQSFSYGQDLWWEKKLRRGQSYICENGWLIELGSNEMTSAKASKYKIAVNQAGELIRGASLVFEQAFSFWCGDHCDNSIPLPDAERFWWERRLPTEKIAHAPPPWKVPFQPVPKPAPVQEDRRPPTVLSETEFQNFIQTLVPAGVTMTGVQERGGGWIIRLNAKDNTALAQFLRRLSQSSRIFKSELIDTSQVFVQLR
jgi:hypothetical protein